MSQYRCYLMSAEKIQAVEIIDAATDAHAVQEAERVFREKATGRFSGFEVWELGRRVHLSPSGGG